MVTTALALPDVALHPAWAEAVRAFGSETMHGSGAWVLDEGDQRRTDVEVCARLVAILRRHADPDLPPEDGRVRSDYYWLLDPDDTSTGTVPVVGFIAVRHELNDFLLNEGGHIGYAVRPDHRRRGHATRALASGLRRLADLGVERALVTCDDDNEASARTIAANGGVLEDVREGHRRYWCPTGAVGATASSASTEEPGPGAGPAVPR